MDGNDRDEVDLFNGEFAPNFVGRLREDGDESRSGSDNFDCASGDDQEIIAAADEEDNNGGRRRLRKYHRHTPQQIQELETFFKECPHPDEKQRLDLSRRLNLETKQVKFWFQNRRTQAKTQSERHENIILKQENDKLKLENIAMRDAMRNPICSNCGGPAAIGEISYEEHRLRIENARLKDELTKLENAFPFTDKISGMTTAAATAPIPRPNSNLELAMGRSEFGSLVTSTGPTLPVGFDLGENSSTNFSSVPTIRGLASTNDDDRHNMMAPWERSMLLEVAMAAMNELVKMAQISSPLWVSSSCLDNAREVLNAEEYSRVFPPCLGAKTSGFARDASRITGELMINTLALVETMMDVNRWVEMFPCLIGKAFVRDVVSTGIGGTRNGALLLMEAEVQFLSPLVPLRQIRFLRFCKQHAEGVWAVVDLSIDTILEGPNAHLAMKHRKLPSGLLVQDMLNGFSKVTWVEHWEYDETSVYSLYRPILRSGIGFGAQRWIATLRRQCDFSATTLIMSFPTSPEDNTGLSPDGKRSMIELGRRMVDSFCSGVCASSLRKWEEIRLGSSADRETMRMMTRVSDSDPGEPSGLVLSAATSFWMPLPHHHLFDFLRNERFRCEWDILSKGVPMQSVTHISKGQNSATANRVSLFRVGHENVMLILQESWTDPLGSAVIYAPVDIQAMQVVMNGGDSKNVAVLPSGFAMVPAAGDLVGGSLLTVGFQILITVNPAGNVSMESVETVNSLVSCTIQKIKAALNCI